MQAPNDYFARKYLFTLVPSFTEHDVSCYLFLLRRESWMFKTRCGNKHWKMCHTSNLCRRVRRKKQLHSGKRENRWTAGETVDNEACNGQPFSRPPVILQPYWTLCGGKPISPIWQFNKSKLVVPILRLSQRVVILTKSLRKFFTLYTTYTRCTLQGLHYKVYIVYNLYKVYKVYKVYNICCGLPERWIPLQPRETLWLLQMVAEAPHDSYKHIGPSRPHSKYTN